MGWFRHLGDDGPSAQSCIIAVVFGLLVLAIPVGVIASLSFSGLRSLLSFPATQKRVGSSS